MGQAGDPDGTTEPPALRGLIVDWGGVLTPPLDSAMTAWSRTEGIDFEHFREVMRSWVGARGAGPVASGGLGTGVAGEGPGGGLDRALAELEAAADRGLLPSSPVHALERGEIGVAEFERELARELAGRGAPVPAEGLLGRLLAGLRELAPDMLGLVRRARRAGLRTALLSNSWGDEAYPEEAWDGAFDAVVISGRVGIRKPEPEIYRHTADLVGLDPRSCVMVDDLAHNIHGAVAVGMVGVLHRSYAETAEELEVLFGRALR